MFNKEKKMFFDRIVFIKDQITNKQFAYEHKILKIITKKKQRTINKQDRKNINCEKKKKIYHFVRALFYYFFYRLLFVHIFLIILNNENNSFHRKP